MSFGTHREGEGGGKIEACADDDDDLLPRLLFPSLNMLSIRVEVKEKEGVANE